MQSQQRSFSDTSHTDLSVYQKSMRCRFAGVLQLRNGVEGTKVSNL